MAPTDKDFIVAIELGSSKISGIAGQKKDGTMQILAYAEEKTTACVKRGIVYNIEKTTQCVNNIIEKLENDLKTKIARAYIGIGGQSVRSYKCVVKRNLLTQSYITNEVIDSIHDESYEIPFADCEVLENYPQEYVVDQNVITDPVGVMGTNIEGEYLNVISRTKLRNNIRTCFANTNVSIADDCMLAPCLLANNVLTDAEKRSGCVLVDLGAGTTTVVVYKNNIIRHLATIPLGSNNITQDLATLQLDESEAEEIKLRYGAAYIEEEDINEELETRVYATSDGRTIEISKIQLIVEARINEIIANVREQIVISNYGDKLLAGIILTGGGSNMRNIDKAFLSNIKVDKVRIAKIVNQPIQKVASLAKHKFDDGMNNTLVSLLLSGEMSCGGDAVDEPAKPADPDEDRRELIRKEQEEAARREAETAQKFDGIKALIRANINKVQDAEKVLDKNGKDKKVRMQVDETVNSSLDVLGSEYDECVAALAGKDKYKQSLKEAAELAEILKKCVEELADKLAKAKKDNSLWGRFTRVMGDLVNEQ
ncbi:MAG: cell division protein FtsA [Bacteroides sp.]|nr:cell division protein FtsA [Roseburia sp.]MCM1346527.1 cell division protein FtsA [Bacteroides sp.]MCM1420107.1 cell division protein FtsA [Bacteroides sp.]